MQKTLHLNYEKEYLSKGYKFIAGCDEAGRGPLAGPVVVASVIMPNENYILGVDDSKKLTEIQREKLYSKILDTAISYKIEVISEKTIDKINILNATKMGMENAINNLSIKPDICLIDAVKGLKLNCESLSIIHGDALSYSIACASILAKVYRDHLMIDLDKKFPEYNFKQHKGYGTKEHIELLKKFGKCDIHRDSFIKNFVGHDE